jgi:hypothetical protein
MRTKRDYMNSIDNHDNDAKAQFDEAARRFERTEERLRALSASPVKDATARWIALEAYEEARLFLLSSEAVLRSAEIIGDRRRHPGKSIVILRGDAHIAESIALLLRLRGFRSTVLPKTHIAGMASHIPAAAIIVDVERDMDKRCLCAVDKLNATPSTRLIAMIPQALAQHDWSGFDSVLVKPASIDLIVSAIVIEPGRIAAT